jgi:hypothetical protein
VSLTTHLGYGPFRLQDFRPGEHFARYNGARSRVADPQPAGHLYFVQVWNSYGTANAERVWLHCTALAYALDEEQARTVERRKKGGNFP